MTTEPAVAATMVCPACRVEVPTGVVCGRCGAHLNPDRGDGPQWCGRNRRQRRVSTCCARR